MKKYTQDEIDSLIKIKNGKRFIEDQDFSNCDLSWLDLSRITFINVSLKNADLRYANLSGSKIFGPDLLKTIRRIME